MRNAPSFRHDRQGAAALEFAFVAPVMIVLIFGLLQLGYVAFARSALESATMAGARYAAAQSCLATRKSGMESLISQRMATFNSFNNEPVRIDVKSYGSEFGSVGNPEPYTDANKNKQHDPGETYDDVNGNGQWDEDMGREGSVGNAGDVVTLSTSYKLQALVPFIAERFNGGQPYFALGASTVVRNEPIFRDKCS